MKDYTSYQKNFFSEISEYQISANEFFSTILLENLNKNFGLNKVLIMYFDKFGEFLSWTNSGGAKISCKQHPYVKFASNDVIRHVIYKEAVKDNLTYFNLEPRLYKSTDIIDNIDYENSAYVRFIEENFQEHYSITMAFGINAYIQVVFFKNQDQGDFSEEEIEELTEIYVYLANAYKNFKKYEQAKIVQKIQNEIIQSGEKAYLIIDEFLHIMNHSKLALEYLQEILGATITDHISNSVPCTWLSMFLNVGDVDDPKEFTQVKVIKDYVFKIHSYNQKYSNGIIDKYYWITIHKKNEENHLDFKKREVSLTPTEQRVVEYLYNGLTYKAIAEKMVVSYHTVKKHVQNIYTKCGVTSRYELSIWLDDRNK